MSFEIKYLSECWKDVRGMPKNDLATIKKAIEYRLAEEPQRFGRPLKGRFKGKWRMRVGDYRVIYVLEGKSVVIVRIGHRREVYD